MSFDQHINRQINDLERLIEVDLDSIEDHKKEIAVHEKNIAIAFDQVKSNLKQLKRLIL